MTRVVDTANSDRAPPWKAMGGGLSAPEIHARSYDGMVAVAQRVQIGMGAAGLVALWVLGGVPSRDKAAVTALLIFVYVPWVLASPKLASRAPRLVNLTVDLLAVAVFPLLIPETRVAVMGAYTLMVSFHAYASGRTAALLVTAGILAVTGVSEVVAPAAQRLDAFTLVMYAFALIGLTVMLDGLAAERRSLVAHLTRLNMALGAVTPDPDLKQTLNSVAAAARDAVEAGFVVVLLERDGRMDVSSQVSTRDLSALAADRELQEVLDAVVSDPETTPSGVALSTASAIGVNDVLADARFRPWHPIAERLGIRSVVAVPLTSENGRLGVLTAYWPEPRAFARADVALLDAYAQQAALAVAKAVAFDRERAAVLTLAEADRMKSDFVARVSHELRTPLTAINGFLSTVLLHWDALDDNAKRELLSRASRNTTDLRRMVEQVLAFAQTGDDAVDLTTRPLALRAEIDSLVAHLLPVLGGHTVDLQVDPALIVQADREALHHVLTNLLANAAKFSPGGTTISVAARPVASEIEISVSDQGPGIGDDDKARIFERFYRSSEVSAKGTGIGLSIVESFVSRMGGRVWVESTPPNGATFTFTVPAAAENVGATALVGGR